MTLSYQKPWKMSVFNGTVDTAPTDSSGALYDNQDDYKSPLRKTPLSDGWRSPLPYQRIVRTGSIDTYDCHVDDSWMYNDYPNSPRSYVRFAGARSGGGTYHDQRPAFPSHLENSAIIKARLKIKDQKLNLAQCFGERMQTADLVMSTCKRLHDGIVAVRRLDPRAAAKSLGLNKRSVKKFTRKHLQKGTPFDLWLELQYGWKPLLSDVYGAVDHLSNREQHANRVRCSVSATTSDSDHDARYLPSDSANTTVWSIDKIREMEYKCKVRFDFVQSNPALATASQLGLTNPLQLAWELLPFSFVVDWFVPIGDFFSCLDATFGWHFLGGSCSTKTVVRSRPQLALIRPYGSNTNSRSVTVSVSGSGREMYFDRTTYGTCPVPYPTLDKLGKASSDHVANGIALVSSAFAKRERRRFFNKQK